MTLQLMQLPTGVLREIFKQHIKHNWYCVHLGVCCKTFYDFLLELKRYKKTKFAIFTSTRAFADAWTIALTDLSALAHLKLGHPRKLFILCASVRQQVINGKTVPIKAPADQQALAQMTQCFPHHMVVMVYKI